MAKFQVKLAGEWKDYSFQEDKILKRAYMAGFPTAKFHLRGQNYMYDFRKMVQLNTDSAKERKIRQPLKWKAPAKPLVPAGPTTVINVPPGSPGTTIQVPHPRAKGAFISVNVPASAKPGQAMLVPVPPARAETGVMSHKPGHQPVSSKHHSGKSEVTRLSADALAAAATAGPDAAGTSSGGWSTGKRVAVGTAAVLGVGGAAVGGAILGEHIAEHGLEATAEAAGDGLEDFFVDAGEFVVDAAEDVGDFVMDLF
jgi:hypothetical protein